MEKKIDSTCRLLIQLWQQLDNRRQKQFCRLFFLIIAASFMEMVTIGSVLPFLAAITEPHKLLETRSLRSIVLVLGINNPKELVSFLTVFFCLAALLAGLLRLFLLSIGSKLSFMVGADLSLAIYRRTLYQKYTTHISRNSSEIINGISSKTNAVIYGAILPTLNLLTSIIMMVSIIVALIYLNPIVALLSFFCFGLIYTLITTFTRNKKIQNSQLIAHESTQVIKKLQEGLGGIRDILIDGSQEVFCRDYQRADIGLRNAQGSNQFLAQSPRYFMETIAMVLIALLAYLLIQEVNGIAVTVPLLGALALGAQRLMPLMQQAYVSWSSIQSSQASLKDALDLLNQPSPNLITEPSLASVDFNREINLKEVWFKYDIDRPWVLNGINLKISKGSRIGFIGVTGSGKSTLLDVVMGLLEPSQGTLTVDGVAVTSENQRSWQNHIAHVPQVIFLSDASIAENIAFGVNKDFINYELLVQCAKDAQISDTIESWPNGYATLVGERGVRLSGGQRQRIGIARALYKRADVIIFDEATSALDSQTELAVMEAIDNLSPNLTILLVAHRLSTLKKCSQIVKINHGNVEEVLSYSELIIRNNTV